MTHGDDILEGIVSLVSLLELCHAVLPPFLAKTIIQTHSFKVIHEKLGRSSSRAVVHLLTREKVYDVLSSGFVEDEVFSVSVTRLVFACTHRIPGQR